MRILEEFWYGNIEPTEYDTSSNKEYKKLYRPLWDGIKAFIFVIVQ